MQARTRRNGWRLALALSGCTDGGATPNTDELVVVGASGGMDGAGSIAVGLRWDEDVFVQELWDEGTLRYLVFNRRAEDVGFSAGLSESRGQHEVHGEVQAQSMRVFDADYVVPRESNVWLTYFQLEDGTSLGSIFGPMRPRRSEHPVVSMNDVNHQGWRAVSAEDADLMTQLETDFVTPPARHFSLTLSLPARSPTITLLYEPDDVFSVPLLEVVAARSDTVPLQSIERGIVIGGTPANASHHLVEVDVAMPEDFHGSLIGFQVHPCRGSTDVSDRLGIEVCGGAQILRLFPVD